MNFFLHMFRPGFVTRFAMLLIIAYLHYLRIQRPLVARQVLWVNPRGVYTYRAISRIRFTQQKYYRRIFDEGDEA